MFDCAIDKFTVSVDGAKETISFTDIFFLKLDNFHGQFLLFRAGSLQKHALKKWVKILIDPYIDYFLWYNIFVFHPQI